MKEDEEGERLKERLESTGILRAYRHALRAVSRHQVEDFLLEDNQVDAMKLYTFVASKIRSYGERFREREQEDGSGQNGEGGEN